MAELHGSVIIAALAYEPAAIRARVGAQDASASRRLPALAWRCPRGLGVGCHAFAPGTDREEQKAARLRLVETVAEIERLPFEDRALCRAYLAQRGRISDKTRHLT